MERSATRVLDEYLVASAKVGDRKAFGLLAERWNRKLIAHAWRLTGDVDWARDAVQSAWLEIIRGLPRLQDDRAFRAWAYRIVTRRCTKLARRAIRLRELNAAVAAEPEDTRAAPDAPIERQQLRSAIAQLPAEQRAAIGLFYLEELSVAEVAVALEIPAGTVKTRLMHARRKLRAALEGEE